MKPDKLIFPAALAVAAAAFLIAPEKPDEYKIRPFFGRNFAHRGLHSRDRSIPENSLPAFEAAANAGYGVELDVHITADDQIIVFHDDDIRRMCGVPGRVEEMTLSKLKELCLLDTECRIPLLSEALDVLGGVPVIVELKHDRRKDELCALTLDIIDGYNGHVCVESFDPFIVGWFRKKAPDILRGQLSCSAEKLRHSLSGCRAFALGNLLTNYISRPNFIAYGIGKKSPCARLCEAMGAMKVVWTSHSSYNETGNDAVIFEFYRPGTKFK